MQSTALGGRGATVATEVGDAGGRGSAVDKKPLLVRKTVPVTSLSSIGVVSPGEDEEASEAVES